MKKLLLLAIVASLLVLTGCRTAPVQNFEDVSAVGFEGKAVGSDKIEQAIKMAGSSLGWQMRKVQPGLIEGTLYLRSHMAKVDIPYDNNSYSILYKDSSNLKYDGSSIHNNYNGWVQRLNSTIQANLTGM